MTKYFFLKHFLAWKPEQSRLTFSSWLMQRLFDAASSRSIRHNKALSVASPAALCFLMSTLAEQRRKPDDVLRLCTSLAGWRSWTTSSTTSWTTSLLHPNQARLFLDATLRDTSQCCSCQFNLWPLSVTQQQPRGSIYRWAWLSSPDIEGRFMCAS